MKSEKLQQLISNKNEDLERQAARDAESLINEIIQQQQAINKATARIVKCRAELKGIRDSATRPKIHPRRVIYGNHCYSRDKN